MKAGAATARTPPPSPPRSASRLTPYAPSTLRVETLLSCGDLTDFRQFSFHIPMWKDPEIYSGVHSTAC
jgi:hypothetical protein